VSFPPRLIVGLLVGGLALVVGCRSGSPSVAELAGAVVSAEAESARNAALDPGLAVVELDAYRGPGVVGGDTGPARYVRGLSRGFRTAEAMATLERLDRTYRSAGSPEFDGALDDIEEALRRGGFDGTDPRFELRWLVGAELAQGWQPVRAQLELHGASGTRVLHAFDAPHQPERVLLPIHAPSARVRGPVVLALEDVDEGSVFVTEAPARQVADRARAAGAVAVVSASLGDYNVDPHGTERHLDAIQYRKLLPGNTVPVAQVSQRTFAAIKAALAEGPVELALDAEVEVYERPLRTLVAIVHGGKHPGRAVVVCAHVNEPGANDNGSGVATLLEGALVVREAIAANRFARPGTSLLFVFGDEFRQSEMVLEQGGFDVIAGISADMTGQSLERTGAIALLERGPDPGALVCLPPDEHSTWGQGEVEEGMLFANGLAVIARCAMVDVGLFEERESARPWPSADHPWEGGSDHDVYLKAGVPAVLFWHFTDFTYHTSLDRPDMVDPEEMRRTGAAIFSTALAVANAGPTDLSRYVESLRVEIDVRVAAAEAHGDPQLATRWREWGSGARSWLRKLCLDLEVDEAAPLLR